MMLSNKDTCEIYCYDEKKVNRIREELQKKIYLVFPNYLKHLQMKIGQKLPMPYAKMGSYACVTLRISLVPLLQQRPITYEPFTNKGL